MRTILRKDDSDCLVPAFSVRDNDGLTEDEGIVMDALCDAANAFGRLPSQHPDEARDFCDAIHRAQDLLAVRIARRHYPKGWTLTSLLSDPPPAPPGDSEVRG